MGQLIALCTAFTLAFTLTSCESKKAAKDTTTTTASAQEAAPAAAPAKKKDPPTGPEAKRIEEFVKKAAALVESKGKDAALAEFRTPGSEWFKGDDYLYAYDMELNVQLNPAFPEREGKSMKGVKDIHGNMPHDDFVELVNTTGSGWVNCMATRPGHGPKPVEKWAYVTAVKMDGKPGIIGSGYYP